MKIKLSFENGQSVKLPMTSDRYPKGELKGMSQDNQNVTLVFSDGDLVLPYKKMLPFAPLKNVELTD